MAVYTEKPIDEVDWTRRGLVFKRTGNEYRFMIDGRSDVCVVNVSGDKLNLFTDRDSAHRALQSVLTKEQAVG